MDYGAISFVGYVDQMTTPGTCLVHRLPNGSVSDISEILEIKLHHRYTI